MIPNTVPGVYVSSDEDGSCFPVAAWDTTGTPWAVCAGGLFPVDQDRFVVHYPPTA